MAVKMNKAKGSDTPCSIESQNGIVTFTPCRSSFLVEFGNVALRFSREELHEFIEFLDYVELPVPITPNAPDERTVVIESTRFGVILLFTVHEFAELYELLVETQIEAVLHGE